MDGNFVGVHRSWIIHPASRFLTQIVNHAASGGMAAAKCDSRALFFQGEGFSQFVGVEADAGFGASYEIGGRP
jgi:hypothetical protein